MTFYLLRKPGGASMRLACAVLFMAGPVVAEDFFDIPAADLPSSATLEVGGDAAGSRDVTLQADFGMPSGWRVRGGYTGARAGSGSGNYAAKTYWAGLNSDPLAAFSYGASYETQDRDDGIRSGATQANLRWQLNNWQVAVYPEFRWLTLKRTMVTRNNKVVNAEAVVRSQGGGGAVTYTGLAAWSFAFRHFVYRYERDIKIVQPRRVVTRIDRSFDASRSAASVDYFPSWGSVGMDLTHNESALNSGFTQSAAVNLSWDVSRAWTVFASAGYSRGKDLAATHFGSAGATWMWDE